MEKKKQSIEEAGMKKMKHWGGRSIEKWREEIE
jgi:hypothetical protein